MIRKYSPDDIENILTIWLETSIKAHNFVEAAFWKSQVENMRDIYLPASESWVYETDSTIAGFYSLYEDTLVAIFVSPELQGQGMGKALLSHAKEQRNQLSLSVYKENKPSFDFYKSQGFTVVSEQTDEHTGHQEYTMCNNA